MKEKMKSKCESCKYYREIQSSDVVFMERESFCMKKKETFPVESNCKNYKKK